MNFSTPLMLTDAMGKSMPFDSIETLKIFFQKEIDFWTPLTTLSASNPTANSYIQKYSNFQSVLNQLISWKSSFETWDVDTSYSQILNLIIQQIGTAWVWSDHPFIYKWLALNETSNSNIADAFFEAIVNKTSSRQQYGFDFFQGYLIAYEFINQDKTGLNKRRGVEVKSLNTLRDQLVEKHNELINNVNSFQNELTNWKDKTETQVSDLLVSKEACLDKTNTFHSKTFHEQLAIWTESKLTLENKYREDLRFSSAAEYWGTKVKIFKKQGYWWGAILLAFLVSGILLFSKFFLGWLSGQPTGLGLQSIEGILIFATVLSSFAFLVKSISKMTFSSFHLMRDAEEREQLIHLYLSLRDGKDDDPESRKIILQALFSRSETGLLSSEQGPTMPSITEFINVVGKSR